MWVKKQTSFFMFLIKVFPPQKFFLLVCWKISYAGNNVIYLWMLKMASIWLHFWITEAVCALATSILFCFRAIQYKCTKISHSWIAWTGTWNCKIWVSIFMPGICLNYCVRANTLWLRCSESFAVTTLIICLLSLFFSGHMDRQSSSNDVIAFLENTFFFRLWFGNSYML